MREQLLTIVIILPVAWQPLHAQTVLDRVDPSRIASQLPQAPDYGGAISPARVQTSDLARNSIAEVRVGAIILTGLSRLRNADFSDIVGAYVGRSLSAAELGELIAKISDRARQRGFAFAQATAAPQSMTAGLLRIEVDEGSIDEVRLQGIDSEAVRASLDSLIGKGPLLIKEIAQRLLIAGDVNGVTLKGARYLRENGRGVLVIDVTRKRIALYSEIGNSGSKAVGPVQADLTLVARQLLSDDDAVTATVLVTPADPKELSYGRVQYSKRISSDGTEALMAVAYSSSRPGSIYRASNVRGTSFQADAAVVRPIERSNWSSVWAQARISYEAVSQDLGTLAVRSDRIFSEALGVYGVSRVAGGTLRANASLTHGYLTNGSDVVSAGYESRRSFLAALVSTDWTTPSFAGVSGRVAMTTQIASNALPPSAQLALGGTTFGRAYNEGERLGDEGTMGSIEFRFDLPRALGPLLHPQLYAFVDGGRVTNLSGGGAGSALFSSGAGIRAGIGPTGTADLGLAVPLSGPRYDGVGQSPVINFRMARGF